MHTESMNPTIILNDIFINETPFVNEECGDTMWDEVLKNMEEKSKEV